MVFQEPMAGNTLELLMQLHTRIMKIRILYTIQFVYLIIS